MDDQPRQAVRMMVDREATAWDRQDVEAQLDLYHPDMVWTYPPTGYDHDPATWELGFGRFDRDGWREEWQTLFDAFELVHNRWDVVRVDTSEAGDGGLAVVDVDTLWRHRDTGEEDHWKGRTAKVYALVDGDWKLTAQWGALRFDEDGLPIASRAGD